LEAFHRLGGPDEPDRQLVPQRHNAWVGSSQATARQRPPALKKVDERVYSLDPFPFASDRLTLVCRGRYVTPFPEDFPPERVGNSLYALPADLQSCELVPAR
jgi:hypothetical protein